MRHRKDNRKLGRISNHREALLRNLSVSLIKYGRIITTEAKAKELRRRIEKLITLAKQNTVHSRRLVYKEIGDRTLIKKLFTEIASLFTNQNGGYSRITKLYQRKGDAALIVMIELVK